MLNPNIIFNIIILLVFIFVMFIPFVVIHWINTKDQNTFMHGSRIEKHIIIPPVVKELDSVTKKRPISKDKPPDPDETECEDYNR